MVPRSFGMIDAYSFGVKTLGKNFFLLLGLLCALSALVFSIGMMVHYFVLPLQFVSFYESDVTSQGFKFGFNYSIQPASLSFTPFQAIFFMLSCFVVAALSLIGKMYVSEIGLNSFDKKPSNFRELVKTTSLLGTYFLVVLLISLITSFGFLLLFIPGIIFLMKYGFGDLIVLDSDLGPVEAIKRSNELTYGHKWRLFGFYALFFLFSVLSSIIPLLGMLFVWIVFAFARVFVYRTLVEIHGQDKAQFTAMKPGL